MPMVGKPLREIDQNDLLLLCKKSWREDEQFELKQDLPSKGGLDSWHTAGTISPYARDKILAEVVAFANSYGGDVVIGMAESGDKPAAAERLSPIPNCVDLAERLNDQARSCIEPPIPSLRTHPVVTAQDGSGVVIVRVSRSRLAPHRLWQDKGIRECYHRVGTRTERMTMRQIQELTFSIARGTDSVVARLQALQQDCGRWAGADSTHDDVRRLILRVAAVPASAEIYINPVHGIEALRPTARSYHLKFPNGSEEVILVPRPPYAWRPIVRGTEATKEDPRAQMSGRSSRSRMQLFCDGAITYTWVYDEDTSALRADHALFPGWLFGLVANAMETAHRIRTVSSASSIDYAMDVEVQTTAELTVAQIGSLATTTVPQGSIGLLPRYSVGPRDSWQEVFNLIVSDFLDAIGNEGPRFKLHVAEW
jgi:Putative DNA-binding domain